MAYCCALQVNWLVLQVDNHNQGDYDWVTTSLPSQNEV